MLRVMVSGCVRSVLCKGMGRRASGWSFPRGTWEPGKGGTWEPGKGGTWEPGKILFSHSHALRGNAALDALRYNRWVW
jgi:hypothetical protein